MPCKLSHTLHREGRENGESEPIFQPGRYLLAAPLMILGACGIELEMDKRNSGLFAGFMCSEIAAFVLDQTISVGGRNKADLAGGQPG